MRKLALLLLNFLSITELSAISVLCNFSFCSNEIAGNKKYQFTQRLVNENGMDTMVPVHLKSFFYSFTRGSIALFNIVFKKINIQKEAHYIDPSFFKGRYKMHDVFFELIGKSGKVPAGQYKTSGVLTAPPEWGQVIPAGTDEQYAGSSLPYGSGLRDKRNPAAAIGKMAQQKMKGSIDSSIRANTRDQQSVIDQNDTEFLLSTS